MVCFLAPTSKFLPSQVDGSPLSSSMGKKATTYLGYTLLSVASMVETVVFSLFSLFCTLACKKESRPYQVFTHLFQRSAFFTTWSISHLFFNFIPFVSTERKDAIACRLGEKFLPQSKMIEQGADFLINEVLKGLNQDDLDEFNSHMDEILPFIMCRSIHIYLWGDKRKELVPSFFGREAQESIEGLRRCKFAPPPFTELKSLQSFTATSAPASPGPGSPPPASSPNFLWLLKTIYEKMLCSPLIGACWIKAIEKMQSSNNQ